MGVFCKKWKIGCFYEKVENGGGCKKVENGLFCTENWTIPQRRVHYVQYQYFLFYISLLGGGCVRTQRPLPTGLHAAFVRIS